MCGIAGLVAKPNEAVEKTLIEAMAKSMALRGPDASGVQIQKNVGLAHRRLKIIDLSDTANQPLFNEDAKVSVVFNGEIYNFAELRTELETLGHRFRSKSDTEVIVHAYEQWGTNSFSRFNGMFAFAILDWRERDPVVYLARDRFGTKPLFYTIHENRLAFASELKPLLLVPWVQKAVDPQMIFYFLKFSHIPTPSSILKGTKQLKPGSWLRFEGGRGIEGSFCEAIEFARPLTGRPQIESESVALQEIDAMLTRVVRRQLVSDVPVGCFLSGGIDSSLLVAACDEIGDGQFGGSRLKTFTIGYKNREFDESAAAREVASLFNTDHREFIAEPQDFFKLLPMITEYFDQPLADPTILSSLLLAKFAKEHVTVALSGDGGDEFFFGYPYQRAMYNFGFALNVPARLRQIALGGIDSVISGWFGPKAQRLKKALAVLQFQTEAEFFEYFIGTFGPIRMDRLANLIDAPIQPPSALYEGMLHEITDLEWHQKIEQVFQRTFMVDTVLTKTDRTGMAFGLEARVPFLDNEIADFAATLPLKFKLHNRQGKYLLRKLLATKIQKKTNHSALSRNKKRGFSIPLRDWLRTDLKFLIDENLNTPRIKREGIFKPLEISAIVDAHQRGYANHSHLLWSLICFQMWKERYLG
jgi:asparagine synthase (glutamine-hydrolysing)